MGVEGRYGGAGLGKQFILDVGGDSKLPVLGHILLQHSQLLSRRAEGDRRGVRFKGWEEGKR
jgi:hypothetical protein